MHKIEKRRSSCWLCLLHGLNEMGRTGFWFSCAVKPQTLLSGIICDRDRSPWFTVRNMYETHYIVHNVDHQPIEYGTQKFTWVESHFRATGILWPKKAVFHRYLEGLWFKTIHLQCNMFHKTVLCSYHQTCPDNGIFRRSNIVAEPENSMH